MPTTPPGGGAEARAARRSNVFLTATLVTAGRSLPVRVRNISARGALVDGANLPPEGAPVDLRRGKLVANGEIAWSTGGVCGVRLHEDIDVEEWTQRTGHSGQQAVDQIVALVRRPATGAGPGAATDIRPSPRDDQLSAISEDLDAACERLAGNSEFVASCAEDLVKLDSIAQRLRDAISRGRTT
jgi:hypothetical protein